MKKHTITQEDARWIEDFLKDVPLTSELDHDGLAQASRELDEDPAFVADYLKGVFVNEVYKAMDEAGLNANQLARKWGKSRQYLSKILNEDARVNFTIETMVELMLQLGRKVELHFPKQGESTMVINCLNEPPPRPTLKGLKKSPALTEEDVTQLNSTSDCGDMPAYAA